MGSVIVGMPLTRLIVVLLAQDTVGGEVSVLLTLKVHVFVLFTLSVAVQATRVTPRGKA